MSTDLQFLKDFLENQSPNIININSHECQTPKSPSFSIPKSLKCPAAPKKPQRVISSCKRKLQFVEIVAREEVESFFRIVEDAKSSNGCNRNTKRRCLL
ncbi:hypothetical protein RND71_021943 [Anisodus tanguticus]|uniref:Uncharacterized protein n=1 Tax=Anisodus tanguticus TaxID=243964 RepID=A0AAE1RW45_9SOLA|nr:hypothetical protein RND71_021943 [Anisodus tanguticus]